MARDKMTDSPKIYSQGCYDTLYDTRLEVHWMLTYMCNYDCSYCFESGMERKKFNKNNFSSHEDVVKVIDHILEINRSLYDITLVGGEPTIHPDFLQIIAAIDKKLGKRCNSLVITTNGSCKMEMIKKIGEFASRLPILLQISLHTEYASLRHIQEIIEQYTPSGRLEFRFMYNPGKRETVYEFFEMFCQMRRRHCFNLVIPLLFMPPDFAKMDDRYTESDFAWRRGALKSWREIAASGPSAAYPRMKSVKFYRNILTQDGLKNIKESDAEEMFMNKLYDYSGLHCALATGLLYILPDGLCRGAVCRLADSHKSKYNIFFDNPYKDGNFIKSVCCAQHHCGCRLNDRNPKFSSQEEATAYISCFRDKQQCLLPEKIAAEYCQASPQPIAANDKKQAAQADNVTFWDNLLGQILNYKQLHNDLEISPTRDKIFLQFFIKWLPHYIHYELKKRDNNISLALHCEHATYYLWSGWENLFSLIKGNFKNSQFILNNTGMLRMEILLENISRADLPELFFALVDSTIMQTRDIFNKHLA